MGDDRFGIYRCRELDENKDACSADLTADSTSDQSSTWKSGTGKQLLHLVLLEFYQNLARVLLWARHSHLLRGAKVWQCCRQEQFSVESFWTSSLAF